MKLVNPYHKTLFYNPVNFIEIFNLKHYFLNIYFERQRERERERAHMQKWERQSQRGRENPKQAMLSAQSPTQGLISQTMRS